MKGLQNGVLNMPQKCGDMEPTWISGKKIIFSDIFFLGIHMHSCIEDFSFLRHTKNRPTKSVDGFFFYYFSKNVSAWPIDDPRPVRPMRWI